MTTIDIDHLLRNEEIQQLLDTAEQAGSLRAAELAEIVEAHELDPLEQDALMRELEQRGIDLADEPAAAEEPPPQPPPVAAAPQETTTDALQLFLREAGRHDLLTAPDLQAGRDAIDALPASSRAFMSTGSPPRRSTSFMT